MHVTSATLTADAVFHWLLLSRQQTAMAKAWLMLGLINSGTSTGDSRRAHPTCSCIGGFSTYLHETRTNISLHEIAPELNESLVDFDVRTLIFKTSRSRWCTKLIITTTLVLLVSILASYPIFENGALIHSTMAGNRIWISKTDNNGIKIARFWCQCILSARACKGCS